MALGGGAEPGAARPVEDLVEGHHLQVGQEARPNLPEVVTAAEGLGARARCGDLVCR